MLLIKFSPRVKWSALILFFPLFHSVVVVLVSGNPLYSASAKTLQEVGWHECNGATE